MNETLLVTAWWWTEDGMKLHVKDLIEDPRKRKLLPLLDQLALELELVEAKLIEVPA